MQTRNVHYAERPGEFVVRASGGRAVIEFPVNVTEVEREDGTEYVADIVYSCETRYTDDLEARVAENIAAWMEAARTPVPQSTTLADVVEALNALTDLVVGGM